MELTQGYALDRKLAEKGKRFDQKDGAWIQLRYIASETVKKVIRNLPEDLRKIVEMDPDEELDVSQEDTDAFFAEVFSKGLIADWSGVEERGKILKPTEANIRRVIKKYDILRRGLWADASEIRNFALFETFEAQAKN